MTAMLIPYLGELCSTLIPYELTKLICLYYVTGDEDDMKFCEMMAKECFGNSDKRLWTMEYNDGKCKMEISNPIFLDVQYYALVSGTIIIPSSVQTLIISFPPGAFYDFITRDLTSYISKNVKVLSIRDHPGAPAPDFIDLDYTEKLESFIAYNSLHASIRYVPESLKQIIIKKSKVDKRNNMSPHPLIKNKQTIVISEIS